MIQRAWVIFNLLTIAVLEGGLLLFAKIARMGGRALPINFIVNSQQVAFSVLILSMFVYISVFDVKLMYARRPRRPVAAGAAAAEKP